MLGVWTIQPWSHEPLQKEKTGTFHTVKHQGRENKGKGAGKGGGKWLNETLRQKVLHKEKSKVREQS